MEKTGAVNKSFKRGVVALSAVFALAATAPAMADSGMGAYISYSTGSGDAELVGSNIVGLPDDFEWVIDHDS